MNSTQYWTGYIRRTAEDAGWIEHSNRIMDGKQPHYFGWILKTHSREEALHEEIYTALTHTEPKLAFRALVQAAGTMARMDEAGQPHFLSDAFRVAQRRIETLLGFNN